MQWMKGIWVGQLDESDRPVVLTPHGTVTRRSVRRLAGNLRVQPDRLGKVKRSCSGSSAVSGRAFESTACFCAHQVSLVRRTQINWQRSRTELHRMSKWKASWMKGSGQRSRDHSDNLKDDNDEEVKRRQLGEPLPTIPMTSDEMMEDPCPDRP